jgi:hypothetical protein
MRRVACFAATSAVLASETGSDVLQSLADIVSAWLKGKGVAALPLGSTEVTLQDGRKAMAFSITVDAGADSAREFALDEPTPTGRFLTRICLGIRSNRLLLFLELRAGGDGSLVAPVYVDVRTPQVLHKLLSQRVWNVGSIPVVTKPINWHGPAAARKFMAVVQHKDRNLPVVAVSEHAGQLLVATLAEDLARDLGGLAVVAHLDEGSSWAITGAYGKAWSCYDGALRIYWPPRKSFRNPLANPLWTRERLIDQAGSEEAAAGQIRKQIRRQLFELSTYTFDEPGELVLIRNEAARIKFDRLAAAAADKGSQAELAEHYFEESVRLEKAAEDLRNENRGLHDQVRSLLQALHFRPSDTEAEISPDPEIPPATVEEAVSKAKLLFAGQLVFGDDVEEGVQALAPDAGPPDKILEYLETLAEMTSRRQSNSLGKNMMDWLRENGLKASNESETIRNSSAEMQKRTWNDGRVQRRFEAHLKPSEGTSPDRCVRIYFDYDPEAKRTIVGWVGRHR